MERWLIAGLVLGAIALAIPHPRPRVVAAIPAVQPQPEPTPSIDEPPPAPVEPEPVAKIEATSEPEPAPAPTVAEQMLAASNAMRYAAGRYGQSLDSRLCAAAQEQATLLANGGYPWVNRGSGHYWGNGNETSRAQKYGFRPGHVAEVITPESSPSVDNAFVHWKGSASHYAAILANDTSCGFGFAQNKKTGWCVYVGLYGTEALAPVLATQPVRTTFSSYYQQPATVCGPFGCPPGRFRRGR